MYEGNVFTVDNPALTYLCDYGSDSDDSDCDTIGHKPYRLKFPVPNLSRVPVVSQDIHEDNPQHHNGRSRLFPHVRGNWATFVFVNYHQVDAVGDLIDKFEELLVTKVESCHRCDDFHISLSKTFVLKYHLIHSFNSSLLKVLCTIERFDIGFSAVKVYCNEDNSRTFVSLEVDSFAQKYLRDVSKKVDNVLTEFQLPTFYENPSFHMSILWLNGNRKSELQSIIENLNDLLFQEVEHTLKSVSVDNINCKSGNKYFQYSLC